MSYQQAIEQLRTVDILLRMKDCFYAYKSELPEASHKPVKLCCRFSDVEVAMPKHIAERFAERINVAIGAIAEEYADELIKITQETIREIARGEKNDG